jgi:P27 family predicted phage terminase small subunit
MPVGRPPKSIEQHKAEGTLRSYHSRTPIVTGRRRRPRCPFEMKGKARDIFNEIVRDLWPARILDRSDSLLILVAALHLETALDAHEMVKRLGTTYPVTRGAYNGQPGYKTLQANPAVNIMRDSLAEFRQCCDLLGIGPSARARLANMGMKGATPAQALPGVGAKPTPLTVLTGERE